MIDVCANQPQPEVSRNTRQEAQQHPTNVAPPSPSMEAVQRFERACDEDTDDRHTQNADLGNAQAASGVSTPCSPLAAAGISAAPYAAQHSPNFAHPHDPSREVRTPDHSKEQHRPEDGSAHNPLGMTHPLDGMFVAASTSSAVVGAEGGTALDDSAAVWDKLSERILVAETPQGGHEVRITVGQDILPGTEISITRHPGGGLTAVLITDNAATLQTLVAGRDDLRHRLESLGEENVQVNVRTSTDGDGGNMERRSRGLLYPDPEAEA